MASICDKSIENSKVDVKPFTVVAATFTSTVDSNGMFMLFSNKEFNLIKPFGKRVVSNVIYFMNYCKKNQAPF